VVRLLGGMHAHALPRVTRDDMHVDMKYGLPRRRTIELRHLHAVRLQLVDDHAGEPLHHRHHLAQRLGVHVEQVAGGGALGDHQRMAEGLWKQVEEGEHIFVLV